MFWLLPLISGLGTWAATGDFKKGLMSGLLGAGIGGIAGALGDAAGAAGSTVAEGVKGAADASSVAGTLGSVGHAASHALPGITGIGAKTAEAAASGTNPILGAGLDFLRNKPVTTGLMLSSLMSAGAGPEVPEDNSEGGQPFPDQRHTTPRNTIPFASVSSGPSTYVRGEVRPPDDPYRYGQYSGEKMFFDNPGLSTDGNLPPLPEAGGGGFNQDDLGILGVGLNLLSPEQREQLLKRNRGRAAGGLLHGPGDGQSDHIPAKGPEGDILLSGGEFVIPADVVSALGAGSTDAGAKRLYSAMDKIRTASFGSAKQARRPPKVAL